ncbi:MAG: phage tail protein [Selenomonadaceae bacterium]|nr:phage tail protein [Selenomonadaceae bacterium]MBR4641589.1 phage tail protein [Selenomonadaceae bacterium]
MAIGCFADLVFEVDSERVLTFDGFKHDVKSRYARHELINQEPVLEWLGADTQKVTMTITLTATLGVNPAEEMEKVHRLCLDGEADWLIVANSVVGGRLWVITEASCKSISTDKFGNPIVAQMDVTFETYNDSVEEG